MPTEIVTAEYAVASWGPVFICIWEKNTPPEGVERALALANSLRPGSKIATMVVIPEGSPMPEPAAREKLQQLMSDLDARSVGTAMVQEGSGFRAAAVRAVLTGVHFVSRSKAPCQIFDTVESASHWLDGLLGQRLDGRHLQERVASLRARIGSAGASPLESRRP